MLFFSTAGFPFIIIILNKSINVLFPVAPIINNQWNGPFLTQLPISLLDAISIFL